MKYYFIECEICDEQSQITIKNGTPEPEFCPLCGNSAQANLLDEEEDDWED